jgi:nucleotide-binding universal stress UspA family protein
MYFIRIEKGGKYMYSKILVPLDGSKLAECVLPHVEAIASGCGTPEVTLVSVTEILRIKEKLNMPSNESPTYQILGGIGIVSGQVMKSVYESTMAGQPGNQATRLRDVGKKYSQADKYLHRIQQNLIKKGLKVQTLVLLGNPAEAIVSFATNNGTELIIMASHGRSGISRWASGSVAERVFRSACIPVLMVRAPGCIPGF